MLLQNVSVMPDLRPFAKFLQLCESMFNVVKQCVKSAAFLLALNATGKWFYSQHESGDI